MSLIHISS